MPIEGDASFGFYLDEELQYVCLSLSSYLDREFPDGRYVAEQEGNEAA